MRWPLLRYFDNEALKAYVELLHNLVKRLGKRAGNCDDLSSAKYFSETSEEDFIPGKDMLRETFKSEVYQKAAKTPKSQVENKEKLTSLQEKADTQSKQQEKICNFCNRRHRKGKDYCGAFNKRCYKCNKSNHFAVVCRTKGLRKSKYVNTGLVVSKSVLEVEKQPVANERGMMKNSSDYTDSETRRDERKKQSILHWINKKLNSNHT